MNSLSSPLPFSCPQQAESNRQQCAHINFECKEMKLAEQKKKSEEYFVIGIANSIGAKSFRFDHYDFLLLIEFGILIK